MPKAQPDHWYGYGANGDTCQRCGMKRRPVLHPNGRPSSFVEWSADEGKTWTRNHTACPMRKVMAEEKTPKTLEVPNCEKLRALHKDKVIVGDFIEWMTAQGYVIAQEVEEELAYARKSFDKLWLDYIEVDEQKLDDERRAILDEQRKLNAELAKTGG